MEPFLHYELCWAWLGCCEEPQCVLQRPFAFPATHPPAIPGCHPPGRETAIKSQGKGTQDALRILEGLSSNSEETLIYALSPRKYVFIRHCSYLGCSYTTASHK